MLTKISRTQLPPLHMSTRLSISLLRFTLSAIYIERNNKKLQIKNTQFFLWCKILHAQSNRNCKWNNENRSISVAGWRMKGAISNIKLGASIINQKNGSRIELTKAMKKQNARKEGKLNLIPFFYIAHISASILACFWKAVVAKAAKTSRQRQSAINAYSVKEQKTREKQEAMDGIIIAMQIEL